MVVTQEYYDVDFMGLAVPDFPKYAAWAERLISQATRGADFAALPPEVQTAYKNAVCAQISYFAVYGLDAAITGITSGGFSVGRVSVNSDSRLPVGASSMVCPAAVGYLEQTGLLNRQIETRGERFLPFFFGGA